MLDNQLTTEDVDQYAPISVVIQCSDRSGVSSPDKAVLSVVGNTVLHLKPVVLVLASRRHESGSSFSKFISKYIKLFQRTVDEDVKNGGAIGFARGGVEDFPWSVMDTTIIEPAGMCHLLVSQMAGTRPLTCV